MYKVMFKDENGKWFTYGHYNDKAVAVIALKQLMRLCKVVKVKKV